MTNHCTLLFLTLVACLVSVPLPAQQWESFTPPNNPYNLLDLKVVQGTPFAVFYDGLYRSLDGGDSWQKLRHFDYLAIGYYFVEANYANNRLYHNGDVDSSGHYTVYESADLGNTWQKMPQTAPLLVWKLVFIGDTLYTSSGNMVYRKYGAGAFQPLPNWPKDVAGTTFDIDADGSHLWVAAKKGIYHSPDAGHTWEFPLPLTNTPGPTSANLQVKSLNGAVWVKHTNEKKLFRSGNWGANWEEYPWLEGSLFSSGRHIYAVDSTQSQYLIRLQGAPQNWDTIPLYAHANIYMRAIGESDNGNYWIGTSYNGVARKKAGEDLWKPANEGVIDVVNTYMRSWDDHLFVTNLVPAFSADYGTTWEQRLGECLPFQFWRRGNYDYCMNLYGNELYRCPANQRFEWALHAKNPAQFVSIAAQGDTLLGSEGLMQYRLYRSVDNGANWTNISSTGFRGMIQGWRGRFYGTRDSSLYVTADGGLSWNKQYTFPHTMPPIGSQFVIVNDTFLLPHVATDRIYMSADGGQSFDTLPAPKNPTNGIYRVRLHGRTLLLSTGNNLLYVSRDLGQTWLTLPPPKPGYNLNALDTFNYSTAGGDVVYIPGYRWRLDGLKQINGQVFLDLNANNQQNYPEQGLNGQTVQAAQSGTIGTTYNDGNFSLLIQPGADTLRVNTVPKYYQAVPPWQPVTSGNTQPLRFAIQPQGAIDDISVNAVAAGAFRAGYATTLHARLENVGTLAANGQFKLVLDSLLSLLSATPQPDMQSGDTLIWWYDNLKPLWAQQYRIHVRTAIVPPGTPIHLLAEATGGADVDLSNNSAIIDATVVSSYDPNDKAVSRHALPLEEADDSELIYTIRFQNLGNIATDFITIRDTLSDAIDPGSLRVTYASHNYTWSMEDNRVLVFKFNPISLSPASTDSLRSQGFVQFTAHLRSGLQPGANIANTAHIYFDFNPAVVTNTVHTIIQTVVVFEPSVRARQLEIFPNPAQDQVTLRLPEDATGGAGRIEVFNAGGRLIRTETGQDTMATLWVDKLPAGIYWCRWRVGQTAYWGKLLVAR